jgi:hypothetical protein
MAKTLDCANAEALERGKGSWIALAARLPELAAEGGLEAVFMENVLEDRFQKWFRKKGYTEDCRNGTPSFWKFIATCKGL